MDKCGNCESRALWECTACKVLLCNIHKRIHSDDEREHIIVKLKFKVSEDLKQNALESISAKIRLIDQFSSKIIKSSKIIVEHLNNLTKG